MVNRRSNWSTLDIPQKQVNELRQYFRAFAWYYGNIPLGKAYELYCQHYKNKILKRDFLEFVKVARIDIIERRWYEIVNLQTLYCDYTQQSTWEREIIHNELLFTNSQRREPLYYAVAGNKRACGKTDYYLPPKTRLLKNTAEGRIEGDEQVRERLFQFICKLRMTERRASNFVGRLVWGCHVGDEMMKVVRRDDSSKEILSRCKNTMQANRFLAMVADVSNSTSMMINNGFTPLQVRDKRGFGQALESTPSVATVSFSEPLRRKILSGEVNQKAFRKLIAKYPPQTRELAWQEFCRLREA